MPIVSEQVKESLKQLDTCPRCQASWTEMEKSLNEGLDSDDCYLALIMIRNCDLCLIRFQDEYNKLKEGN